MYLPVRPSGKSMKAIVSMHMTSRSPCSLQLDHLVQTWGSCSSPHYKDGPSNLDSKAADSDIISMLRRVGRFPVGDHGSEIRLHEQRLLRSACPEQLDLHDMLREGQTRLSLCQCWCQSRPAEGVDLCHQHLEGHWTSRRLLHDPGRETRDPASTNLLIMCHPHFA